MPLSSFLIENYRAFGRRQNIELRPLTLFFGWNSGGKSALVRLLPLVAESLRVGGPPLWLGGEVGRKSTWPELVCKATERDRLRVGLRWDKAHDAEWLIRGDMAGRWQEIEELQFTEGSVIHHAPSETLYTGLSPRASALSTLALRLQALSADVQWITGLRVRPPRLATYGGGTLPLLRADGSDAIDHLIAAQLRSSQDPLLEVVRGFFAALGEELVLDNPMDGAWRVLVQPTRAAQVRINLSDTGEGYAQVLPILVALGRARGGGPRLLCLEQPELHLHTRAQVELSRTLVETAQSRNDVRLLVETHSEVLLTSVQLAIAKGTLKPEQVRVYWIESRPDGTSEAAPVDFDELGYPKDTALMGAFAEATRLGQALVSAQLAGLSR